MIERVLTDNSSERTIIKWDGTRFAIVHKSIYTGVQVTTILNPREMLDLIEFAGTLGGE